MAAQLEEAAHRPRFIMRFTELKDELENPTKVDNVEGERNRM